MNENKKSNQPVAFIIEERLGLTPGDEEYADAVVQYMKDPNYGLNKNTKATKPVKIKKTTVATKQPDKIQDALNDAKARRAKYTGGLKNWFK